MAKTSVVARQAKRQRIVKTHAAKRTQLREIMQSVTATPEEKWAAQVKLQKLPRDSSVIRLRRRCQLTGRPRGVLRKFGIGRSKLRELAMSGEVPGLVMASW
jgi:small subunit ribosomal protein S14